MIFKKVGNYIIHLYYYFPWEAFIWISGITALALYDPSTGTPHMSFCLFKNLGFSFCPGCGLGRSIAWLLHGNLNASLKAHPLGIFALFVLVYRIKELIINFYRLNIQKLNKHG